MNSVIRVVEELVKAARRSSKISNLVGAIPMLNFGVSRVTERQAVHSPELIFNQDNARQALEFEAGGAAAEIG